MKKGLIKAFVLAVVFVVTLAVSGQVTNKNQRDLTTEMEEATLPIIVLYDENQQINELHGYTMQMNATEMRDTITPLSGNREIPLLIRTYDYQIDNIAYEIRSIDGSRLISDGNISSYEMNDGQIRTSVPVQSLLEMSKEYILTLKLKQDEDICYYYTRIADAKDCYVAQSVEFAQEINELTFSENPDALSTYWEPNASGDNSTLHKVTINSSLMQANWADFNCDRLTTPVPSIKEMNSSYNVIMLNYVVTSKGNNGEVEYYNVEEYYRIRYTTERMYLLNFERTMNQIFNGENEFLYENFLQLGIRDKNVEYMQNETGTITCFVQEGDLWSYNQASGRLAQVFSFRGHEGIDVRENHMQHDINILSIDEAGDINYVVYGYMNRGSHEGRVGISLLHYDSQANTNEEGLFLAFDKSYEVLRTEISKLLYENAAGDVYLLFNGTLYRTELATLEINTVAEGLAEGDYAVSKSNQYLAWSSDEEDKEITVMDLENGRRQQIRTKAGKTLRVLGFLEEDLVYGMAAEKHKRGTVAGISRQPMYALRIVNASDASVLKTYRKNNYYIDSVEFQNGVLVIQRMTAGENGYVKAQPDSIVSRGQEDRDKDIRYMTVTDVKQTQIQLVLAETDREMAPILIAAKQVMNQEDRDTFLKVEQGQQIYYAYAKGRIEAATTDIGTAIQSADENMGVVVDGQQNYIWKRARKSIQPAMDVQPTEADQTGSSVVKCLSAMLKYEGIEVSVKELIEKGDTPREILESLLSDREVICMEGCTLSQVFYYVSCGVPVLAAAGSQDAVLVTGYDAVNVTLYDPQSDGTIKSTLEDAEARFSASGGIFIAVQPAF